MSAAIYVEHLSKSYFDQTVLRDVSLSVAQGEVVSIIGLSGSGKSTLLKIIAGLETPDAGPNGGIVKLSDPDITMVFQYSALFDSMTVYENVAFSLLEPPDTVLSRPFKKLPEAKIKAMVKDTLHLLGMEGIEEKYPAQLSGGMQKRVSFARAVMSRPKIILYDEPTAGLDPIASTVIEDSILTLRKELNVTSVVVTHQMSTILRTSDRICLLEQGELTWQGTPHEFTTTTHPQAYAFAHAHLQN